VIWLRVPFRHEDEAARYPNSSCKHTVGAFNFVMPGVDGAIAVESLPISREHEGLLCLFPANLAHSVNPFYGSDDWRISVSGNVAFDVG
jgi:hypothetical protein